jgi:general secretion pathway protein G
MASPLRNARRFATRRSHGFTLVEILIVVIILGILAAIVIPQFTGATEDARKTNMRNQLQTLRGTSELYRVEHRDTAPLMITTGWDLFTAKTDIDGNVDPLGRWGPYMQAPPVNPLTNSSAIVAVGTGAATSNGWFYNETTGQFFGANRDGAMSDSGD